MIYPAFLKEGDCIGVCAPSAGVGDSLEEFETSLDVLRRQGYEIRETAGVRLADMRGGTAQQRGEEISGLFRDEGIQAVFCAAGGDFLYECMPYIRWQTLRRHPKWLVGMSDPTSILFTLTVKYDIATIYGYNAGEFGVPEFAGYDENCLAMLQGRLPEQYSTQQYLADFERCDVRDTYWQTPEGSVQMQGHCIGGCIDVLKDVIGTKYDHVREFVRRYKEDGIVWYFDNFSLSTEVFYRTLLQMREAGWLRYASGVMLGRTLFPSSDTGMDYGDALAAALPDVPYMYDVDIGHTRPSVTMMNGAIVHAVCEDGRGSIRFELKP